MFSVHAILKCGIFIALPLLSSMFEGNYQCRAVASQLQQNSEILAQIDSGLVSYINRVKTFRQVTFEAITNSGGTEIEVSSKDDNFAIVIRPISAGGHYTSNVYGSNEDYGFWLGNPAEGTDNWVIRSISDYQNNALQDQSSYSYGNLLKTLADSGMISLSSFRPFSYLQFSNPSCGVESTSQLADSTDLYLVSFRPKLDDVVDKFGKVHNLSTIKSGKITFSKSLGFLPVNAELQRSLTLPNGRSESWLERLEWTYDPVDDYFRLDSFVSFRPDMPVESRFESWNYRWDTDLPADAFRITRFGLAEPGFIKSSWTIPFWFWLVVIGILVILFSWVLLRRREGVNVSV